MLNIEYAPSEMEGDVLDCLATRDVDSSESQESLNLGLSEDLTEGFRAGNGTRFLVYEAEDFLLNCEEEGWLTTLKAHKEGEAPLVVLILGALFAPASDLTYTQRADILRIMMVDPDLHVLTLEDAPDVAELILAFARVSAKTIG
jgi:hypothetical protein